MCSSNVHEMIKNKEKAISQNLYQKKGLENSDLIIASHHCVLEFRA